MFVCSRGPKRPLKKFHLDEDRLTEILEAHGVTIVSHTSSDLLAYCCFHHNKDSPALNISLSLNHPWKCHNGKCGKSGNIVTFLMAKGYSHGQAEKYLLKGIVEDSDLAKTISKMLEEKPKYKSEWDQADLLGLRKSDAESGYKAREYLHKRGIHNEAYNFFEMGYSPKKNMLTVPVHDERGRPLGIIGRSIDTKRYQYSNGLNRASIIWNIHRVIREGYDSIVLTEGSLDAVYLWEAGYRNVGAVLGSSISAQQWSLLRRYFSEITLFFDNDDAGNSLRDSVLETVTDMNVYTVEYPTQRAIELSDAGPQGETLHRPLKDPGELTTGEIVEMMDNKVSHIESLLRRIVIQ